MSAIDTLYALWGEIADLGAALGLLEWDQETTMPPKGLEGRGKVNATLAGIRHSRITSPALAAAIEAAAGEAAPGSDEEAQVREARRVVQRVSRIPEELARARAEAEVRGHAAWKAARERSDFSLFHDALVQLLGIAREEGRLMAGEGGRPYDALLDRFEPGTTEADLVPLFAHLREGLVPIVRAVAESGTEVDESPLRGEFRREKQLAFAQHVATRMGFDFEAGRIDAAPHPFCSGAGTGDVRLTWRWHEDDVRSALFGIMHEAGHGLYEQGLPRRWERTPLGEAASYGMHESQSRLWENAVGRSRAFWEWALPLYQTTFPAKRRVTLDEIWPALHTTKPSLIRVEADEGTYDLHIAIRFELERALFAGDLDVADLPAAWSDAYAEVLGIRPRNTAEGVLQDIHWSMGAFGYFPSYTIGNFIQAQLWEAAHRDLAGLDGLLARGEFAPLLEWLRENVHRHGRRYSAAELVERVTGRPLAPDAHLAARAAAAREVYGVTV
ncbi:MAG: carboxypeptidase M32 [Planctomycetota bacterium]